MSRSGPRGNRAEGGCRSVAGWLSPDSARVGYRSGVPERILRSTWTKRYPPWVAWTRRRRAPAAPNRPARSASLVAQRGQPAVPAARTSSGAARGVCCLPSGTPNTHASHSVPFSPTRPTRTSTWSTNPRAARPNGSPAAQLQPPADAPSRWACPGTAEQARHGPGRCPGATSPLKDALLRGCSVTVIIAGAGLSLLRCGRGCESRATWRYSLSTARGDGQL